MLRKILFLICIFLLSTSLINARARLNGVASKGGKNVKVSISNTYILEETYPACTVTIYLAGTTTLASIYSNNSGTVKANPFTSDALDASWFFYADNGRYDVKFSGTGISSPFTVGDFLLVDTLENNYNVANFGIFGAVYNGSPVAEDAALASMMTTVCAAGGGHIVFNNRRYKFTEKFLGNPICNNGESPVPTQPIIRITGTGGSASIQQHVAGGTIIDLRYNGAESKIDARGLASLEIAYISFVDDGPSSSVPFLQATNTTVRIHDNEFLGNTPNIPTQDAIILGNTSTTLSGNFNAPFQGYGSEIYRNTFNRIRRGVYAKTFVNGIKIEYNTFGIQSGGIAAIEFDAGTSTNAGNVIIYNLSEGGQYNYFLQTNGSFTKNTVGPNNIFDESGTTLAAYHLQTGANFNKVTAGMSSDIIPLYIEAGTAIHTNEINDFHQDRTSIIPQRISFLSYATKIIGDSNGLITENANGDQWLQDISNTAALGKPFSFRFKTSGGGSELAFQIIRSTATDKQLFLGGETNNLIFSASNLKLAAATGSSLSLGTIDNQTVWNITNSSSTTTKQIISSLTTGTAPLIIASVTPVDNLNLTSHPKVYNISGTLQTAQKEVMGTGTLSAGTIVVTFTSNAVFANTSYICTGANQTNANTFKIANTSASSITITGTGSDVIGFHCIGL